MEASESESEPASTCQGSHCETDPRPPKPKHRERLVPLCIEQSLTEHGPKPIHFIVGVKQIHSSFCALFVSDE